MVVRQASGGVKARPQTAVRGENPAHRRGENPSWTTRSQASGEVITQPQTAREVKTPLDLYKVVGRQVARCSLQTAVRGENPAPWRGENPTSTTWSQASGRGENPIHRPRER